jgi:hypothetical protein
MILDVHPFLENFTRAGMYNALPPQMKSRKEKRANLDENGVSNWEKRNMDTFESIARFQYMQHRKLIDNERLLNGEFIESDYLESDEEDFSEPLNKLIADGKLPKFVKHYDMFRSVIETQVGEFEQAPDTFGVVGKGEQILNDKMQVQLDMLNEYVEAELTKTFQEYLQKNQIVTPEEFQSEEEEQAFQQQMEQMKKARTPEEIGMYMKMNPRHQFEIWAEEELKKQIERFNIKKLRREEFKDYLVVGRRFREITTTKTGLSIKPLNYVNVFYHKSPNIQYVQQGDYAGTVELASASFIIDKYGHQLTKKQLLTFETMSNTELKESRARTDFFGNSVNYLDFSGNPYNTFLPSSNNLLNRLAPNLGMNHLSYGTLLPPSYENNNIYGNRLYVVTKAYWKSYELVGRLCWNNPSNDLFEVLEVDEDFIIPSYIKELPYHNMQNEPELNTIVWMYKTIIMEGSKINNNTTGQNTHGIYFNIKKCEYQPQSKDGMFKSLPIFGQIANNKNTKSVSQVDLIKPYQFLYNVVLNKAYKILERSILPFVAHDIRTLPNQKDWGGDESLIKWIETGNATGVAPMDTSPSNTLGANSGGQFPRVIDLDTTPRIIQHLNIASAIRGLALSQLGFTPERLGDISQSDTATGINVSITKSFNATASWFTDFYELEREILNYQLQVAQWLQSNNKDYSAQFSNSILTQSLLKTNYQNLTLYDLDVYVTNSQEELRKLEMYKKLGMELNTTGTLMSSRMEMGSMTNAQRILEVVKYEEEKAAEREQQIQQFQQQQEQAKTEIEKERIKIQQEQFYAKLEAEKEVAFIRSSGYKQDQDQDLNKIPDALEYQKFQSQASNEVSKLGLSQDKLNVEREKEQNRRTETQQKLSMEQQKVALKEREIIQSGINSRIMGDKTK